LLYAFIIILTDFWRETLSAIAQIPDPIQIPKTMTTQQIFILLPTAASAVSLQEKGMRRKAAEAADAAAARLERRERKRAEL